MNTVIRLTHVDGFRFLIGRTVLENSIILPVDQSTEEYQDGARSIIKPFGSSEIYTVFEGWQRITNLLQVDNNTLKVDNSVKERPQRIPRYATQE